MRIVVGHIVGDGGKIEGDLVVHTDALPGNTCADPTAANVQIPMLTWLTKLHAGTIPIAPTGWNAITNHALYPGQTFMTAFLGEIVRMNDVAARTALGV